MLRPKKNAKKNTNVPSTIGPAPRRELAVRLGEGPTRSLAAGERLSSSQRTHSGVDLYVVFDTTGSMNNKIDGLVACTSALVGDLAQSELDWLLTAIPFGDLTVQGDTIDTSLPWVNNQKAADAMLRSMRRNGGGANSGESAFEAVNAALAKKGRSDGLRVVLLVTDEPALTHAVSPQCVLDALRQADVLCNVISPDIAYYRKMAEATGGSWLHIASHVDMGGLIRAWGDLGARIAARTSRVAELGGSPQRLMALETGGPR